MNEYNSETNTRVRTETGAKGRARWACCQYFFNVILLALVVFGIVFFDFFTFNNILPELSVLDPPRVVANFLDWQTVVYSIYIELVGAIMEWSVVFFNNRKNFRYNTEFNNNVQIQLFTAYCINFFCPLLYIAFRKRNYQSMFTMMLIVIVLEQGRAALLKWIKPLCCYRHGINKQKTRWADKGFKETDNPGQRNMIQQQVLLNSEMMDNDTNISTEQMNYVMQFGYIALFGTTFPIAALVCLCCNYLLIKAVKNNFEYSKRIFPEISLGIGQFMTMLDLLSFASVVVNCGLIFFSSNTYRKLSIYDPKDDQVICFDAAKGFCANIGTYFKPFKTLGAFFTCIVVVEHIIIIVKVWTRKLLVNTKQYDADSRINDIMKETFDCTMAVKLEDRINKIRQSVLGKKQNKDLLDKLMLLDLEEEEMQNKFNRIAKAGAIRLKGIEDGKGKLDVIQDLRKFKKKRTDYTKTHYGIKPIGKERAFREDNYVHNDAKGKYVYETKEEYRIAIFPQRKSELLAETEMNSRAIKQLETNIELEGLQHVALGQDSRNDKFAFPNKDTGRSVEISSASLIKKVPKPQQAIL